jgi:hypothetical protein
MPAEASKGVRPRHGLRTTTDYESAPTPMARNPDSASVAGQRSVPAPASGTTSRYGAGFLGLVITGLAMRPLPPLGVAGASRKRRPGAHSRRLLHATGA